jgi:hypothetical protein
MKIECDVPIGDEFLLDYWSGDLTGQETDRLEEHVFECGDCASRLEEMASLGTGIARLAREGRISGIISRTLLNRMQRDGVHVRFYSLLPGETVPCAAFPGDDLVVVSMRANLEGVQTVILSVRGLGDAPFGDVEEVPVFRMDGEVLWATPGMLVRNMPSTRLRLTLLSTGSSGSVLGEYVLDYSAL